MIVEPPFVAPELLVDLLDGAVERGLGIGIGACARLDDEALRQLHEDIAGEAAVAGSRGQRYVGIGRSDAVFFGQGFDGGFNMAGQRRADVELVPGYADVHLVLPS